MSIGGKITVGRPSLEYLTEITKDVNVPTSNEKESSKQVRMESCNKPALWLLTSDKILLLGL